MMRAIDIKEYKNKTQKFIDTLKNKIDQYLQDLKKDYPNLE